MKEILSAVNTRVIYAALVGAGIVITAFMSLA